MNSAGEKHAYGCENMLLKDLKKGDPLESYGIKYCRRKNRKEWILENNKI